MAQTVKCLTPHQLRQLALGEVSEPIAAACGKHLEQCPTCLDALRRLNLDDPLLQALSAGNSRGSLVEVRQEQGLIGKLSSLSVPGGDKTIPPAPLAAGGRTGITANDGSTISALGPGLPPESLPPSLVGHPRYRILAQLGSGGMGAVYKAEHLLMHRVVALKVIGQLSMQKPGVIERFLQEVKAAARLTHPNIVTAHDADRAGDVHFLVMEYVEGKNLAQLVQEGGPLPVAVACRYIQQAARGLQHAYEQGMVHRDIKPHNLMLAGDGKIKILDFGLARLNTDGDTVQGLTDPGLAMGTPDYIAPEQAMDAHKADIRADIYSLGCTLYHLLAGRPPFAGASSMQKIMSHVEEPPPSLRAARPGVPAGLQKVVERMLAKKPAERYQTPAEVFRALAPFVISNSATQGDKETGTRPLAKVARKPKRGLSRILLACLCAGLLVSLLLAGVIYVKTDNGMLVIRTDDKDIEVTVRGSGNVITVTDAQTNQKLRLKSGKYEITPAGGRTGYQIDQDHVTITRGGEAIVHITREKAAKEEAVAPAVVRPDQPGKTVQLLDIQHFVGHRGQVNQVALSPRGDLALTTSVDTTVRVWDVATGRTLRSFEEHPNPVWCVAVTPDGQHVVSGSNGAGNKKAAKEHDLRLWKLATGEPIRRFAGNEGLVTDVVLSPDGERALCTTLNASARFWNIKTGEEENKMAVGASYQAPAISPDGKQVAVGCWNGEVVLCEAASGRRIKVLHGHTQAVRGVAFSSNGRRLLTGSLDGTMRLWDLDTGQEFRSYAHPTGVGCVRFLPGGQQAVTGSGMRQEGNRYLTAGTDACVRIWDLESGQELARHEMAGQGVHSLAVSADGRLVLVGGGPIGTARLLWVAGVTESGRLAGGRGQLVITSAGARVPVLVLQGNKIVTVIPPEVPQIELAPGAYDLALAPSEEKLRLTVEKIRVADGGQVVVGMGPAQAAKGPGWKLKVLRSVEGQVNYVVSLALSGDGRVAVAGAGDHGVRLWDVPSGEERPGVRKHEEELRCVAVSADAKWALSGGGDAPKGSDFDIRLWDTATGKEVRRLKGHKAPVVGVAFTPDAGRALSGGLDRTLRLWDTKTGECLQVLSEHWVSCLALASDGKRALTGGQDGSVRLWDLATGKKQLILMGHRSVVKSVAFSPDGRRALSSSLDNTVRLWDLERGEEIRVLEHPTGVLCVAFTRDGKRALTGSGVREERFGRFVTAGTDYRLRLWDLQTGEELARHDGTTAVGAVAVAPDGQTVLVGTHGQLFVLKLPE